jgi:hypothetical protein
MIEVVRKRFESPDETRVFEKGRFEIVRVGSQTLGRATYEPGWKWSAHVGPSVGTTRCEVEHVGLVLSGVATVAFDDGQIIELRPGCLFHGKRPAFPCVRGDPWWAMLRLPEGGRGGRRRWRGRRMSGRWRIDGTGERPTRGFWSRRGGIAARACRGLRDAKGLSTSGSPAG